MIVRLLGVEKVQKEVLMLSWQNNLPRFFAKGFAGDRMVLSFGRTNIDDIEISESDLEIQLLEHQGVWLIETQWYQYGDRTRKLRVDAFLSKLKLAVKMHKDFDFSKYLHQWSYKDAHFSVVIHNSTGGQKEHLHIT